MIYHYIFKVKQNTFKNLVDSFDKFSDHREGWKNSTVKKNEDIYKKLKDLDQSTFEQRIIQIINNETTNEKNLIEYDGYFRRSINSKIQFTKEELESNLSKSLTKQFVANDQDELGLSCSVKVRKNNNDQLYYITCSIINISDDSNGSSPIDNPYIRAKTEKFDKQMRKIEERSEQILLSYRGELDVIKSTLCDQLSGQD